jgi:pyruvate formate lyase activating enzyme
LKDINPDQVIIFNIQRYSIHDGEGIRTNIFFKGCPLKCKWCSNPEGQSFSPEVMFDEQRCQGFGDCVRTGDGAFLFRNQHLEINRKAISDVQLYWDRCPSRAIQVAGREESISQIVEEIAKDSHFYLESGGGITLTGGEPLEQGEDLMNLIHEINLRNIPVAVETSLHLRWDMILPFLPLIAEFLVDLKHTDAEKFRNFTGGRLALVLDNLQRLDASCVSYRIRIPVIPGFNHSFQEMEQIIDYAENLTHCHQIDLIPYHTLGANKYKMLGISNPFEGIPPLSYRELDAYIGYAEKKGFQVTIGG